MSQTYERILEARSDMTNWLIHFTKAGDGMTARDRLIKILKEGLLKPSWSIRGSKSTIYGPDPVVCFSEQPLLAFSQYLDVRGSLYISGYGVIIHKQDAYADGALPVIYGLPYANEAREDDAYYQPGRRIINPAIISLDQQYRYVVFNPNGDRGPIDWSHEREWRWSTSSIRGMEKVFCLGGSGTSSTDRGLSKGRTHIFVEYDEDIEPIRQALDPLVKTYDKEGAKIQLWERRLAKYTTIISLETMKRMISSGNMRYSRFDTWPESDKTFLAL